jgi:chromate reductase
VIKLIGISGSLRRGSYNSALLRGVAALLPATAELRIESIDAIPLYNSDIETGTGIPEAVQRLKDLIAAADGLVLATPEYNNGIPGVAKNVIDWLSRPPTDSARVFRAKPIAILGGSPGAFGTVSSQNAWLPVLRSVGADVWAQGRLVVPRVAGTINASGEVTDAATLNFMRQFIEGFVQHVASLKH